MSVYRTPSKEPTKGELRHKVWAYLIEPTSEQDPIWVQRCKDYWELQAETYGWHMSDFTIAVDWQERVVVTWSVLQDILPGERRPDYVVPRVAEERARRQGLTS